MKHPREWAPWQQKIALWSLAWWLTVVTAWAGFQHYGVPGTGREKLLAASTLAFALVAWGVFLPADTRRTFKRWKRRLRKRLPL